MTAAETPVNVGGMERSVAASLYRRTKDQQVVSSDDLRRLELDKYLNDRNGIGGLFAWMVTVKLIREVGRAPSAFPSTHHRKIGLYVWCEKARRMFFTVREEDKKSDVSPVRERGGDSVLHGQGARVEGQEGGARIQL